MQFLRPQQRIDNDSDGRIDADDTDLFENGNNLLLIVQRRTVAVPVFSGKGELLGAMNLSTNALRVSLETITEHCIPVLKHAAEQIKQDLR